ncbi:hypothetical protein CASFOL_036581 [Castilleja foliolosa]|uniref:Uncharacterized protein n=1 Tax=Castilleja foliolosa TaxID=1961234 RepID=A0ABD3BX51_9LAMI
MNMERGRNHEAEILIGRPFMAATNMIIDMATQGIGLTISGEMYHYGDTYEEEEEALWIECCKNMGELREEYDEWGIKIEPGAINPSEWDRWEEKAFEGGQAFKKACSKKVIRSSIRSNDQSNDTPGSLLIKPSDRTSKRRPFDGFIRSNELSNDLGRMFPGFHSMASFDRMSHRMNTSRLKIRIKTPPSSHFFIFKRHIQKSHPFTTFQISFSSYKILPNTSRATHCCKNQEEKHPNTPQILPNTKLYHTHKVFDKLPEPSFLTSYPKFRTMPPRNSRSQGTRRQRGDISQQHGVPFPVFNEEEVAIFKSLETRHVTSPKWFDLNQYEQDARLNRRFGSVFTGYIDGLKAGVLARNKRPGFKPIMLEFITTFKIGVTGNMTYRLNGKVLELKEDEVTRLMGIDGHGRVGQHDEDYDSGNFWNYLTGGRPGNFSRLQASRIHDDEVYVAYKFIAHVILNKDESSVISKAELYALWCMTNGKPVRLIPLITSSLEYIIKSRTKQSPAYMAFGGLITMIADFHGIDLDDDEADYPSEEFAVPGRKIGNAWRLIPQNREEELPDSGNDDDDEDEDEDAFDDGARPRRRGLANEPAYMEVDERELDEDEEDADYQE